MDGCLVEETGDCRGEIPRRLVAYWTQLCKSSDPDGPHWRDIDLMAIRDIAPHMIVKDIVDGGREYRNRFWGTRVAEAFLFDGTGLLLHEYYDARHVAQLRKLYEIVVAAKRPVRIHGEAVFFAEREHVRFEAAHMPLYDDAGNPSHVIMAYDFFPRP